MKKLLGQIKLFCFLTFSLFITSAGYTQIELSSKAQVHYYSNPNITEMNPDPSIVRVVDDYYLVTSTFGFFSGLPIYQIRDLLNRKLIGHGIDVGRFTSTYIRKYGISNDKKTIIMRYTIGFGNQSFKTKSRINYCTSI